MRICLLVLGDDTTIDGMEAHAAVGWLGCIIGVKPYLARFERRRIEVKCYCPLSVRWVGDLVKTHGVCDVRQFIFYVRRML